MIQTKKSLRLLGLQQRLDALAELAALTPVPERE